MHTLDELHITLMSMSKEGCDEMQFSRSLISTLGGQGVRPVVAPHVLLGGDAFENMCCLGMAIDLRDIDRMKALGPDGRSKMLPQISIIGVAPYRHERPIGQKVLVKFAFLMKVALSDATCTGPGPLMLRIPPVSSVLVDEHAGAGM